MEHSVYTVSQEVPTFKLCQILTNLKNILNLLQNPYDTTNLTLGMLLHYLGKLKIQILCGYSADMEQQIAF